MNLFDAIEKRRSVRRFTPEPVPADVIRKALHAATLAPNSSNVQTWNFYWVRSEQKRNKLIKVCFSQSAARQAQELVVVVADPALWRRSQQPLVNYVRSIKAPKMVVQYYDRLIPFMYRWGFLNSLAPFKWLAANVYGIFKPISRTPFSKRDLQEVAVKSAALASQNFVLAVTAQGFSSCMMEGFDELRLRRLLKLSCSARVVMVIGVGKEAENGTWGPRFRIESSEVIHEV